MSRSRRHTPITGLTTSESATRDKGLAHRRHAVVEGDNLAVLP
jgi:hypothetical protein